LPEPYRAAVYYAPESGDALWARGSAWLGQDCESGFLVPRPDVPGIAAATSGPRRYGFHATLKPPLRLRHGFAAFLADLENLALQLRPFAMPRLRVADDFGFLAILPAENSPALDAAAALCVTALDAHRLPEDAAAQAKRAAGRTPAQLGYLQRYGYPYVLDEWRFHMTLSNNGAGERFLDPAQKFFADALASPRMFESLAVYVEAEKGADFRLVRRVGLGQAK
jgi:hypothetical protein